MKMTVNAGMIKEMFVNCDRDYYSFSGLETLLDYYDEIDNAGNETLYSYNTPIIKRLVNGSLVRLWGGWSNTTGKHIKAFCGLNKAGFIGLEHKQTPQEKAAAYNGTLYR